MRNQSESLLAYRTPAFLGIKLPDGKRVPQDGEWALPQPVLRRLELRPQSTTAYDQPRHFVRETELQGASIQGFKRAFGGSSSV